MQTQRIAAMLMAAKMGLMPEVNSAIQIRSLLEQAGMVFDRNPNVNVAKTKRGTRFQVFIDGYAERAFKSSGTATVASIVESLVAAGLTEILVQEIQAGQSHHISSYPAYTGSGFFIEFFS